MKYYELINKYQNHQDKQAIMFLIVEIADINKSILYQSLDKVIEPQILLLIEDAIYKYLKENIPVQYILGYTYFYGLKIKVNSDVLIPRFDTEEVVETVINKNTKKDPKIIDLCTGSGCIACALKKHIPNASVTAIDISKKAVIIAKENASYHNLNIDFKENDLLTGINEKYDIIVSNPPYLDYDDEIMPLVYHNEPHLALFSQDNGMYHYRKILEQSKNLLLENGFIVFEIAYNKKIQMINLVKNYYQDYEVLKDIHNNDRIMIVR